ncbi:MAG: hypothetical protein IT363_12095 [Methanoregulaceae archaeon]|nr:hypothetical protein [Methanoregulaceae archaeon]
MAERNEPWDASYEDVRLRQEADIARLTTPAQRLRWLEDAFEALAPFVKPPPELGTDD